MNEITLTEPLAGLETSKAAQIKAVFDPMVSMLEQFEGAYTDVMAEEPSKESCSKAKRLRLDIAKIRVSADKERKALKEEYLRGGNAVQGVYNILKFAVVEKEDKLKERETHFERMEEERRKKLQQEREEILSRYDVDGSVMKLGEMDSMVWDNFLNGTKTNWEAQKEAERKAEEDRKEKIRKDTLFASRRDLLLPYSQISKDVMNLTIDTTEEDFNFILGNAKQAKKDHDEEQARIRKENERLKKEAEEAEEKRIKEEEARRAQEEKKRKLLEAEQKARDEELRKEREAREAAEKEARAQKAEQDRKTLEEKEAARKAALAPERDKLVAAAVYLIGNVESFESATAITAIEEAYKILISASDRL